MPGTPPLNQDKAAPFQPGPAVRRGAGPLALAVLMTVLFLTFLDNTVVSVALGSVQSALPAGVTAGSLPCSGWSARTR